jgi:hypothetical protein
MAALMIIDESLTAKGYTPASQVVAVFGRPRSIESITIHHWGVPGQSHDGVVRYFVHGPGTTSAHFVVSAGRVNCLVSPHDAAWHAGNPVGNATSIGIECRPEASAADYVETALLVRHLRRRFGDLPLIPHRDWQATQCPGIWDLDLLDTMARAAAAAPTTEEDDMFNDQDRAELKLALDKANRAAQVADAIEDDGTRAKVNAIFDMLAELNEGFRYLKADDDDTLFEFEDGKLRGITKPEWDARGNPEPRKVSRELLEALKAGK